ncbi:aquaporin [Microbacterium sediminicola]|uniref:Aquaporin n=1 Tax=Microbacterium sediminicola TaxID=415210 RepID=A0ABN2IFZ8_9MICO
MSDKQPTGEQALRSQVGLSAFKADWTSPAHRARRLVAEFFGVFGLTFILSGGAAVLTGYGDDGSTPPAYIVVLILSLVSALWLVAAIYFLGDISAHFNPAMTLAFALRGDMGWVMAVVYWLVQFAAATLGTLVAMWLFGDAGGLASVKPQPGMEIQAVVVEAILVFLMVLMVLGMANGPKLNGQYVPLAVGAYILAFGTMAGAFDGAAMNPARAFGPNLIAGAMDTYWVYLVGAVLGAIAAVGAARFLRGRAKAQEASAAMGNPTAG